MGCGAVGCCADKMSAAKSKVRAIRQHLVGIGVGHVLDLQRLVLEVGHRSGPAALHPTEVGFELGCEPTCRALVTKSTNTLFMSNKKEVAEGALGAGRPAAAQRREDRER